MGGGDLGEELGGKEISNPFSIMSICRKSYRLVGRDGVARLSGWEQAGGLVGVAVGALGVNGWRGEYLRGESPKQRGRGMGEILREAVRGAVGDVMGKVGIEGGLAGALRDALWITPGPYRCWAGVVARVVAGWHPREAGEAEVVALVGWLEGWEGSVAGPWEWLLREESREISVDEFRSLRELAPEAAFLLWVLELRGTGWGGLAEGEVPEGLRGPEKIDESVLGQLGTLLMMRSKPLFGWDELRLLGDGFAVRVMESHRLWGGLMRDEDRERFAGATQYLQGRWVRVEGDRFVDVGAALAQVRERQRVDWIGRELPWSRYLDSAELRRLGLEALLGSVPGGGSEPGVKELEEALWFVESREDGRRRKLWSGGVAFQRRMLGLTRRCDWDGVFLEETSWAAGKWMGKAVAVEVRDAAWEWMCGLVAPVGRAEDGPPVVLPMVLAPAFLAMAGERPGELLRWVGSFRGESRRRLLNRAAFLQEALAVALRRLPGREVASLEEMLIWGLQWLVKAGGEPCGTEELLRSFSVVKRKVVREHLERVAWRGWVADLGVAYARVFPEESQRMVAGRAAEMLLLLRGLTVAQLEAGGWGREWRSAGAGVWPVSDLFAASPRIRVSEQEKLASLLAWEDPCQVMLAWLSHRPYRAAAVERHGLAVVEHAESLERTGRPGGMVVGDGESDAVLRGVLAGLRREEVELERRAGLLGDPQRCGPAALAALAQLGRLDVMVLSELDREKLREMLPVAAALAPERPAVWQALELSLWVGLRWYPFLIRLAVARVSHHRSGGVPGHMCDGYYQTFERPKRSGGKRVITAPRKTLRALQRDILRQLEREAAGQPEASAHGFVPGRSTLTNAQPHAGQAVVVNLDIRGFFPSTPLRLIQRAVLRAVGDRLSIPVVYLLADICAYGGALPTGAPTSPWLANVVLAGADKALAKVAGAAGLQYTRYADDLTFSGGDGAVGMIRFAEKVLGGLGYELDPKKINIFRRGRRQVVTGLVVNERVNLPRQVRRRIRAVVHAVTVGREPVWHGRPVSLDAVRGALGWWHQIHPEQVAGLMEEFRAARGGAA